MTRAPPQLNCTALATTPARIGIQSYRVCRCKVSLTTVSSAMFFFSIVQCYHPATTHCKVPASGSLISSYGTCMDFAGSFCHMSGIVLLSCAIVKLLTKR